MRVKLADQLPRALGSDPFVQRLTSVFDHVNGSVLAHANGIEWLTDVAMAPDAMRQWMTSWLAVDWDGAIPTARAERLLRGAGEAYARRGTKHGLEQLLRSLVGINVYVTDPGGTFGEGRASSNDKTAAILIRDAREWSDRFLVALLDHELPADVAYTLVVDARVVVSERLERGGWQDALPAEDL